MYRSSILLSVLLCLFFAFPAWAGQEFTLKEIIVVGRLNKSRESIAPSLGATDYNIGPKSIDGQSQGNNAPFNQVILRAPGAAEDSFGQLHIRGEHANLQYRINDVLLPEGISGFGQELDTRFLDNVSLITGALPAQYGFHTAGIVDIHTKSGLFDKGGVMSLYGGAQDTFNPSFSYGGSDNGFNYFFTGSYMGNALGIENPTEASTAIHDRTRQEKVFAYISKIIDDTSRIGLMLSSSYGDFEIPDTPGLDNGGSFTLNSFPGGIASGAVNDRQTEQNSYAILTYQKSINKLNFQISAFTRGSKVDFKPDIYGDLYFNGIASQVKDSIITNGIELDSSYKLNDRHTLRAGILASISETTNNNTSQVFPADTAGDQIPGSNPFTIIDDHKKPGELYGFYLQDEWKLTDRLTINYGARFDQAHQYLTEGQFSPRINVVYKIDPETMLHAGYARYFTPPPMDMVQNIDPHIYDNTTNAFEITANSPVKAERSHYFDIGITHNFLPGFKVGLDNYYKIARNQLDEGQFGQALVFTPFNYKKGKVYGTELTVNYSNARFSAYSNLALSRAMGKGIASGQFLFGQDELDYIDSHWVHLDHDQTITGSTGISYAFSATRVYADLLYGSGLRKGFANTEHTGFYKPLNIGIEHNFQSTSFGTFKARLDVVNVFDETYELRDGSGIGVGAPQFGQRRGVYAGVSFKF